MSDPAALERLPALMPPGSRPSTSPVVDRVYSLVVGGSGPRPGVRRFHVAYAGGSRLARTHDLEVALERIADRVSSYVAVWARRRVFVHAGVVGWRGSAILVPGRTMTGKSWLVRALVEAGAEYYSDEFAVLDRRGRVHPYPLPLGIRDEEDGRGRRLEDLSGQSGRRPLPVGLVVLTGFRPGRRWRPRALSQGRAVLALLNHTVPARRTPERAVEVLCRAVSRARVLKGTRGEADPTARLILDEMAGTEAAPSGALGSVPSPLLVGG